MCIRDRSYSELAIKTVGGTLQPITIGISILSIVLLVIAFFIIDNLEIIGISKTFLKGETK